MRLTEEQTSKRGCGSVEKSDAERAKRIKSAKIVSISRKSLKHGSQMDPRAERERERLEKRDRRSECSID
jgi:hypothetical protein